MLKHISLPNIRQSSLRDRLNWNEVVTRLDAASPNCRYDQISYLKEELPSYVATDSLFRMLSSQQGTPYPNPMLNPDEI